MCIGAFLATLGAPRIAAAQGFISPFLGYNFGGDSGCPEITGCDDKHANYGVSLGAVGNLVGFETEFGYTNDFLGHVQSAGGSSTTVWTIVANFMLAPKFGPIQPYGVGGVGLFHTSVDAPTARGDVNQVGWDVGGGLMGFFNPHVGIRGDVRYFHSFEVIDPARFPNFPIGGNKLDFGRASIAVVFKM